MSEKREAVWREVRKACRQAAESAQRKWGVLKSYAFDTDKIDTALHALVAEQREKVVAEFADAVEEVADVSDPAFLRVTRDWWDKLRQEASG